jgi:hypothetical protein
MKKILLAAAYICAVICFTWTIHDLAYLTGGRTRAVYQTPSSLSVIIAFILTLMFVGIANLMGYMLSHPGIEEQDD